MAVLWPIEPVPFLAGVAVGVAAVEWARVGPAPLRARLATVAGAVAFAPLAFVRFETEEPFGGLWAAFRPRVEAVDAILPVAAAAGALAAIQIAAAVAGRGRAAPLARADPFVRGMVALAILGFVVYSALYPPIHPAPAPSVPAIAALLGAFAAVAVTCRVAGNRGGESVLVPLTFGIGCGSALFNLKFLSAYGVYWLGAFPALVLAGPLVVVPALRILRLGRRELGALGITAWAPGDIALAPSVATFALYDTLERASPDAYRWFGQTAWGFLWTPPLVALAFVLALAYLRRRIDAAEARAAGSG